MSAERREFCIIFFRNEVPACSSPEVEPVTKERKFLRSSSEFLTSTAERPHVLPNLCIICRTTQYETGYDRKRRPERLAKCELVDGGQLTEAAVAKGDDRLLPLIKDKDCVAIEVQYHASCHRAYTRFLSKPKPTGETHVPYSKAFHHFVKHAVEETIIQNKEIIRLIKLKKLFVKAVHDIENKDASHYKTWNLKQRLQREYPQLCFLKPKRNYDSEFVYVDTLCTEDLVEDTRLSISETSDTSGTDTDTSEAEAADAPNRSTITKPRIRVPNMSSVRDRYATALDLRQAIRDIPRNVLPWPPSASDLTLDAASEIVPGKLFNFIAWVIGASNSAEEDDYVDVKDLERRRILNIAQDIIYLASKGTKPMPKQVSLAMALRHLSGSARLIGLMNGLGYSASHSYVLEHDTALAKQEILRGSNTLPSCLRNGVFTTVVWDNNDFGEETLSGKGSTHNTNGIAIQHELQQQTSLVMDVPSTFSKKTKQRTLPAPDKDIIPFGGLKKASPEAFGTTVPLDAHVNQDDPSIVQAKKKDAAYYLAKVPRNRLLPSWTGFNQLITTNIPTKATIGYLPVIDASPTELSTVNTILHRSVELADTLELPSVAVVVDQAIYAKAQTIRWQTPNFMKRIVIRLGAFHTIMTALACVGKRFGDAGLQDILIESEVVASGSMNGVISGHHYNRSIRSHKLLSEALQQLRLQSFLDSLSEEKANEYREVMIQLHTAYPSTDFQRLVQEESFGGLHEAYKKYIHEKNISSATFAFWSSYLDMISDVLLLIRASREGNWVSHLAALRALLPWMFAYDRTHYARYLPVYWLEMKNLATSHPFVYTELMKGNFAVQRQNMHGFAMVPCDMTIEQTANRDSKTRGGMKGFTTNKGAVNRWIRAHHERAAITSQCEEMAGRGQQTSIRADLTKSRMDRDQQAVDNIMNTIVNMVNPFDSDGEADSGDLIHLASGVIATTDVCSDLLGAYKKGDEKVMELCQKRLQKAEISLNEKLPKQKLKTFSDVGKTVTTKEKGKTLSLRSDRELMARLVILGKKRNIDLPNMLSHCLGQVPLAIATADGRLVKTNKAKLMHFLESAPEESPAVETPKGGVWIVDGMALLQQLSTKHMPPTMGDLASKVLRHLVLLACSHGSETIHFVTDRYPTVSVKNAERQRRAACGSERIRISRQDQPVPRQWKKYMSNGYNKEQIIEFLFERWQLCKAGDLNGVSVYIAHGALCHMITLTNDKVTVTEVDELHCSHEEADTRMYLHAHYITNHASGIDIIINSPDTDVLVLGVALTSRLGNSQLYFHTGKDDKLRTLDLQKIEQHLGADLTSALIGLHCFTGCDSVSGFFGKGKTRAPKIVMKHREFLPGFQALGNSFTVSQDTFLVLENFVCSLYGQSGSSQVNTARYLMFSMATRAESSMPPNSDALHKHIQRANYQAAIFKCSLEQHPTIPSPVGNGWKIADNNLRIDWMDMEPAQQSILELSVCSCKKSHCKAGQAPDQCCANLGIPCTELCTCKKCENDHQNEITLLEEGIEEIEDGSAGEDIDDCFEEEHLIL